MKKQTVLIHAHLLSEHLKPFDDWFIENKDGMYKITLSGMHNHMQYLEQFDYNRRQYDFYIIPMKRSECEQVGALLASLRASVPAAGAAAKPLSNYYRLIIMLKDRGMSNGQIAKLMNTTENAVKKIFQRLSQRFHVKGYHAVIRHSRRDYNF
jgi:hypothetical protein